MSLLNEDPATPPQGDQPDPPARPSGTPPEGGSPWWKEARGGAELPDDHPLLSRYEGIDKLVESHEHLRAKLSGKGLEQPGPDASQDDRDAYYKALGWPEKPEEYQIELSEELREKFGEVDDADIEWLKKTMHENRIPAHLAPAFLAIQAKGLDRAAELQQAADQGYEQKLEAGLREEWGDKYDARMAAAKQFAKRSGLVDIIEEDGIPVTPGLVKWAARQAAASAEPVLENGSRGAQGTHRERLDALNSRRPDPMKDPLGYRDWEKERFALLKEKHGLQ